MSTVLRVAESATKVFDTIGYAHESIQQAKENLDE